MAAPAPPHPEPHRSQRGALRVLLWGALAQAATAAIGHAFGVAAPG